MLRGPPFRRHRATGAGGCLAHAAPAAIVHCFRQTWDKLVQCKQCHLTIAKTATLHTSGDVQGISSRGTCRNVGDFVGKSQRDRRAQHRTQSIQHGRQDRLAARRTGSWKGHPPMRRQTDFVGPAFEWDFRGSGILPQDLSLYRLQFCRFSWELNFNKNNGLLLKVPTYPLPIHGAN